MFSLNDLFGVIFGGFPNVKTKLQETENKLVKAHDDLAKLRLATDTLAMRAMHRRLQKAEGELAKIDGEPGGLAHLRNEVAQLRTDNEKMRQAVGRALIDRVELDNKLEAVHRRAQKAEGELVKIGGLANLRNEVNNNNHKNLIIENTSLRELVRWFLLAHNEHDNGCDAWGCTDLDVCRNNSPMHQKTCDYPHCNCEATMKRDSGRKILGIE